MTNLDLPDNGSPTPASQPPPPTLPRVDRVAEPSSSPATPTVTPTPATDAGAPTADQHQPTPVTSDATDATDATVTTGQEPAATPTPIPTPTPPPRATPRVMAVANQKGGVGKTTTTVNMAACLAELGQRTLIIDLDPQGNATTGLGVNPWSVETSMYDVLLHGHDLDDCIEPTSVRNLFVAPANLNLAGAEVELVPVMSRETRLRSAIEPLGDDYDYILIDCPPSLGLLTVNGLAAAREVLVPIQCEYYALEGLGQLLRNVDLVKKNLNGALEVSTLVLVMYDARTKLSEQVAQEVRNHFGSKVMKTIIPRSVRLSEAPSYGQPISVFDPSSRGAISYRMLAKEVSGVEA